MLKTAGAIVAVMMLFSLSGCSESPKNAENSDKKAIVTDLKNEFEKMNKKGPTTDSSGTVRTDKVELLNDMAVYHQTLLKINGSDVSSEYLKSLKKEITSSVCSSEDLMKVINIGVGIEYNYNDKKGKPLFKFSITKDTCKKPS